MTDPAAVAVGLVVSVAILRAAGIVRDALWNLRPVPHDGTVRVAIEALPPVDLRHGFPTTVRLGNVVVTETREQYLGRLAATDPEEALRLSWGMDDAVVSSAYMRKPDFTALPPWKPPKATP